MNPVSPSGPWSLGTLIGLPLAIIVVLICLVIAVIAFTGQEYGMGAGFAFGAVVMIALILSPLGMYPYNSEYHQWRTVTGPVEDVSKRLVSTGDKMMAERFVVRIGGQAFGVDDTRASLVKPGDTVRLACKREWQYAAQSGWACRWKG